LMLRLGADQARAQALLVQSATVASKSQMVKAGEAAVIEIAEPFDRAWRRVGVAIDRLGFTVEDRDRTKGLFFVRYRDPTVDLQKEKTGFFARIFSSGASSESAEQYRLSVIADGQDRARISVQDKNGKPAADAIARRMLGLLFDQLK
jgi:outer membrane protein assembly factor BamC